MAQMLGTSGTVKDGSTAIGEVVKYSCSIESDLHDVTKCLSSAKENKRGLIGWSGTIEVFTDPDGDAEQLAFLNEFLSGDGAIADLRLEFSEGDSTNGYLSGSVILHKLDLDSGGAGGLHTTTYAFTGTGLPTWTAATA